MKMDIRRSVSTVVYNIRSHRHRSNARSLFRHSGKTSVVSSKNVILFYFDGHESCKMYWISIYNKNDSPFFLYGLMTGRWRGVLSNRWDCAQPNKSSRNKILSLWRLQSLMWSNRAYCLNAQPDSSFFFILKTFKRPIPTVAYSKYFNGEGWKKLFLKKTSI